MIIGDAVEQYKKHLLDKEAIAFCVDIAQPKKCMKSLLKKVLRQN